MILYNSKGQQIEVSGGGGSSSGSELTDEQIRAAYISAVSSGAINIGANIGATMAYTTPNAAWEGYAEPAYQAMLEAYKEHPNSCIPFFISTDQHGRGVEAHRYVNNIDVDGMNIVNINLGDTVQDYFRLDTLNGVLSRIKQVKNYIGVVGNHDVWTKYMETCNNYDLCRIFTTTNFQKRTGGMQDFYSVIDTYHNAKFIALCPYYPTGSTENPGTDGNVFLYGAYSKYGTEQIRWLIDELSLDDGYDIVILQHQTFKGTTFTDRSGNSGTADAVGRSDSVWQMLKDYNNRSSGTITDSDGVSHTYDFTGAKGKVLCSLHGHHHHEWYGKDEILSYVADWYGNGWSCTFGLIDRVDQKLNIFKFDYTQTMEALEIDL